MQERVKMRRKIKDKQLNKKEKTNNKKTDKKSPSVQPRTNDYVQ